MVVVTLKSADQKVPVNGSQHRIDESKLSSLGSAYRYEVGDAFSKCAPSTAKRGWLVTVTSTVRYAVRTSCLNLSLS